MPVILATDVLVWLLVLATLGYALYCRSHAHLAVPWARVFRSPAALASAVVLAAYVALGLLDSLHFRPALPAKPGAEKAYSSEVLSVLDLGLAQLRGRGDFAKADGPMVERIVDAIVDALWIDPRSGGGYDVYVGGTFLTAGGAPASRIAVWNGAVWSPLGSGLTGGSPTIVEALAVFDPSLNYRIAESPWCGDEVCLEAICKAAKDARREARRWDLKSVRRASPGTCSSSAGCASGRPNTTSPELRPMRTENSPPARERNDPANSASRSPPAWTHRRTPRRRRGSPLAC